MIPLARLTMNTTAVLKSSVSNRGQTLAMTVVVKAKALH